MKDEEKSVIVELPHLTSRKETSSLMNSITQDMKYRQSLMKYVEKYGVSQPAGNITKADRISIFGKSDTMER